MKKTKIKDNSGEKIYNFLINCLNQTNITGKDNLKAMQLSSLFIFIDPYKLESCNLEGLDVDIKIDDNGTIWLDDQPFKPVEIEPGITVFGITKNAEE